MAYSILPTKLNKPQIPDSVISRSELLKDSDWASVILVSAQAGAGKSTVVSSWLSEQGKAYSWYSIDEWDNDLTQFFALLITGMKPIDEQAAERLEQLLDAYQSIGFEAFSKALIYQLHAIDLPFILVFDDFQLIQNTQIHQVFRSILEHMPRLMQIVLITREDPPLPLAKLRADKKLLELRISQLRFTEEEVKLFFLKQLNLNLNEEQLQLLFKRTEGWIAGLQLTVLSMRGLEDVDGFIDAFTGSHYYVMDYLMEEVLEHQAPEIKEFLLKTAVLEVFSGELCEAVVQIEAGTGSAIIERLVKTNSFIISMDSSRKWFRYHHLFRDILRQRLEQQSELEVAKLHHRAGRWFKMVGREQEAIQHFLKANSMEDAAALIECKYDEMDLQLKSASWLDMAKQLPMSVLEKSPVLAMGYGWALLDQGDIEGCNKWFEKAQDLYDLYHSGGSLEGVLINDKLQFELLPVTIASARGYIAAALGDFQGVFKYSREALAQVPGDQFQKRAVVAMLLAVAHWGIGELKEAEEVVVRALEDANRAKNSITYNSFHMVLGELYIQQGLLEKASTMFNQTIARVKKDNQVPMILASLYLGLAKTAFLDGDNIQAYALLEESKSYGQKYSLIDWKYKYYLMLARVYCSEGFFDLAQDCLQESKANFVMTPMPDDVSFEDMEIMIAKAEAPNVDGKGISLKKSPLLKKERANQSLVESLTVRELEVLGLIAAGLSNQEIGDTLFLSLNTIKGYNKTIFGKLQVKRRTEAVVKANEIGLV